MWLSWFQDGRREEGQLAGALGGRCRGGPVLEGQSRGGVATLLPDTHCPSTAGIKE